MKQILIVGAGWLGVPLAKKLGEEFFVQCSYRSESTKNKIEQNGLNPIGVSDDWSQFDTAIFCFPPGKDKEDYPKSVQKYVNQLPQETRVILTSSTGIYPNISGRFKEDSIFQTPDNKIHLEQAEEIIKLRDNSVILRLGGLIGGERHPIKFISGRPLRNPDGPINLIHQNDVIRVIESSISESWNGTINVASSSSMSRMEYYSAIAKREGLQPPIRTEEVTIMRIIDNSKLINDFGFIFANPIDNLNQ